MGELIRALRHRHREMEAKRRRDARKIKDLQVSITPNRALKGPVVPEWDRSVPEEVLSNSYIHCENSKEFFEFLSGLIGNKYSGETVYNHKKARMVCTVRKMEKKKSGNNEEISRDYKFVIELFKSVQYAVNECDNAQKENVKQDVDDIAAAQDDKDHTNATNKDTIYVVRRRRISGDDLKFRELQKKIYLEGQQIFNGLPDWALAKKTENDNTESAFDALLKNWDNEQKKVKEQEIKEDEYVLFLCVTYLSASLYFFLFDENISNYILVRFVVNCVYSLFFLFEFFF